MRRILMVLCLLIANNCFANSFVDYIAAWFDKRPHYQEKNNASTYFSDHYETKGKNTFVFDPKHLVWAVYDERGNKVGAGHGVGGKDFCPDIKEPCRTVEGAFAVFRKEDADCTSKTFPIDEGGGAPMPHCMFFHKGYAIHGSNSLPKHNASHGCIRVSKKAAEWMNVNYIHKGSTVVVLPYA